MTQLEDKIAVVYGAAGSMGGAVARGFAEAGAEVHLVGRTRATLEAVAAGLTERGRAAHVAVVDVDDQAAVARHVEEIVATSGRLDVSFNAVGMDARQDVALVDMDVADFLAPIETAARRTFITATAAARAMSERGAGAIVTLTSSAAREWRHEMGGFSVACASIEVLTRTLAGELKGTGVRVAGIRANFTPETAPDLPDGATDGLLTDVLVPRLPRLAEVAAAAVFLASDSAGATTAHMLDLTSGAIVS